MATPRGIRNSNPGNIRISGTPWCGKIAGNDPSFETFDTAENGIRAMVKVLFTYFYKHKLNTIHGIISRWAPASENNTAAYVRAVAKHVGVMPDGHDPISLDNVNTLLKLVEAIIQHENGQQPYSEAQILEGVRLAEA